MATLYLVLAKPVVKNLQELLAFLPNQLVKRDEIVGSKAFHRDCVSFEATFSLLSFLQVEVHRINEVTDYIAKALKPNWVEWSW